jgi:hypothetical protein
MTETSKGSGLNTTAAGIFGGVLVFCGFQMVPGWFPWQLHWPTEVYYALTMVSGAAAGVAADRRYWAAGIVGGAAAGFGALLALAMTLERLSVMHKAVFLIVAGLGSLPGVGLYLLLKKFQDVLFKNEDDASAAFDLKPQASTAPDSRRIP